MSVDPDRLRSSGRMLADAATLVERVAHTVAPSSSTLGRIAAAVSVVEVGTRLIPEGGRLFRRYPVASLLIAGGVISALYLMCPPRAAPRARTG